MTEVISDNRSPVVTKVGVVSERTKQALKQMQSNLDNGIWQPLSEQDSLLVREHLASELNGSFLVSEPLYNAERTQISTGFNRLIIGDYGAYLEIAPEQICHVNIANRFPGTPSRPVKYLWMQTKDAEQTKVYFQQGTVRYADYKIGMYYVCPSEVATEEVVAEARCQATMYGHMCEGPCPCHSELTQKFLRGFIKNPQSFRKLKADNEAWRQEVGISPASSSQVVDNIEECVEMSKDISGNSAPVATNVGVPMNEEAIENMFLVGSFGVGIGGEVELFSSIQGGPAEVVYVYPSANANEREAARKYSEEHGIPMFLGGIGTCTECGQENIPVEEDLDTTLCAPCRRKLYTQGPLSQKLKETQEVITCTCCGEKVDIKLYKTSTEPRAKKVAWDVAYFKLCEMCINSSIIGYDQTGCKFQVTGGCTNPSHPGEKCLGHSCPLNTGTPPQRTSLLSSLEEVIKEESQ